MKPITAPTNQLYIRYTKPTHSGKCLLLTIGGVLIVGKWDGEVGQYFLGWCPMPKRDKELERELNCVMGIAVARKVSDGH